MLLSEIRADFEANVGGECSALEALKGMLFNPGLGLLVSYRCYRWLMARGGLCRMAGRILWRRTVRRFGCFISPKASIEGGISLPHPTGIVIGDGVCIRAYCTIYQSVTIGADNQGGYPTLDRHVTVFPNSVVIGNIRIGAYAIIGAHSFVKKGVKRGTAVAGVPAKVISS